MMAQKSVTLNPGESETLSFEVIPHEAEVYQVTVDGLTGSFVAIAPPPPIDYLLMSKVELYIYLANKSVSNDWWGLPESDRRILASKIINWWSKPIGRIQTVGTGDPDCAGNIHTERDITGVDCGFNVGIRYCLIGGQVACPTDEYYLLGGEWHCGSPMANDFHLPVFPVECIWYVDGILAHAIVAIQVGIDPSDFNSWIFFQYSDTNIKPGSSQMPSIGEVRIYEISSMISLGAWTKRRLIASWSWAGGS